MRVVPEVVTQTYGMDFRETFAPTAKLNSMGVLLSLEINIGLNIS